MMGASKACGYRRLRKNVADQPVRIRGIPARRVLISQPYGSLNLWAAPDRHHAPFISTYIYEANLCHTIAMTTPKPKISDPDSRCEDAPGTFPTKSTDIAKRSFFDIPPSRPKDFSTRQVISRPDCPGQPSATSVHLRPPLLL